MIEYHPMAPELRAYATKLAEILEVLGNSTAFVQPDQTIRIAARICEDDTATPAQLFDRVLEAVRQVYPHERCSEESFVGTVAYLLSDRTYRHWGANWAVRK